MNQFCFTLGFLSQNSFWKLSFFCGYKGYLYWGEKRMWNVRFIKIGVARGLDSRLQSARSSTRAKHARSWSVMLAGALQDKIGQLAVLLSRDWISRLSQAARPSHKPALFWKTWLFTFHSHHSINIPYTHKKKERFQGEFWERNPRVKQDWFIYNYYIRVSSNFSTLFLSIVNPLRGLLPKHFLTLSITMRGLFGVLGSS